MCVISLTFIVNKNHKKGALADALVGADIFIGVSAPGCVTQDMVKTMAKDAVVMAMANPVPEIMPELAKEAGAAVVGTGRSDFPNQINNVLAFPGIFRGALDVRASDINEEMKIAAVHALRDLAKLPVSNAVCDAYGIDCLEFGREYIIPKPMDARLINLVPDAVAKAAIDSGVATKPYPKHYPLTSVDEVFNG